MGTQSWCRLCISSGSFFLLDKLVKLLSVVVEWCLPHRVAYPRMYIGLLRNKKCRKFLWNRILFTKSRCLVIPGLHPACVIIALTSPSSRKKWSVTFLPGASLHSQEITPSGHASRICISRNLRSVTGSNPGGSCWAPELKLECITARFMYYFIEFKRSITSYP